MDQYLKSPVARSVLRANIDLIEQGKMKSYFPLRIMEIKTESIYLVNTPQEIPSGVEFRVLECNAADNCIVV